MKTELLSPAKDKETAFAAIDCGADAVYMGAAAFGARKNAPNSLADIRDVVNYAHKFRVKVFITLNTILTDSELNEAVTLAGELDKIGVDALIVQDMGFLEKIKTIGIPVHISTQADNRDLEKVSFFNNLGVARVVLARELSLKQIKEIHDANPNLELEAFVHGALCVSYSGQCYLSQYIGGRSANRGECAQPCRKKYSVETVDGKIIAKDIYALCLKDFNASNRLKDMIDAGVYSFKIEGRLKDSNYVKNITAYYRHELDKYSQKSSSGKSIYRFKPNPQKSFNRGFTDYFLEKRKDCFSLNSPKSRGEYIGVISEVKNGCIKICTDKTIHPQDGLTDGIDGFLVNKIENNYVYPNDNIGITLFAGETFTQCPLTVDHAVLLDMIHNIKCGLITDGTAVGMGIANAVTRLKDSKAKSKVIILLTDGTNNKGDISPMTAAEIAKSFGIRVYTIGVGTNGMAPYPYPVGNTVQYVSMPVEIDEKTLTEIAGTTDGNYFRATSNSKLKEVYEEIDKLEKTKLNVKEYSKRDEEYHWFALAAFLCVLLEVLLRNSVLKKIP